MPEFWKSLLSDAWSSALSAGSSTSISVLYLSAGAIILTFALTVLFEWLKAGHTMTSFKSTLKQWPTYVIPLTALGLLWIGLFGWSVVKTIYTDHQNLVNEKNELYNANAELTKKLNSVPQPLTTKQLAAMAPKAALEVERLGKIYQAAHPGDLTGELAWINEQLTIEKMPFQLTSMGPMPVDLTLVKIDRSHDIVVTHPESVVTHINQRGNGNQANPVTVNGNQTTNGAESSIINGNNNTTNKKPQ